MGGGFPGTGQSRHDGNTGQHGVPIYGKIKITPHDLTCRSFTLMLSVQIRYNDKALQIEIELEFNIKKVLKCN